MPTATVNAEATIQAIAEEVCSSAIKTGKEHGDARRGVLTAGILLAAAFVHKPDHLDGSEEIPAHIVAIINTVAATEGPAGMYQMILALAFMCQAAIMQSDANKTDSEASAN